MKERFFIFLGIVILVIALVGLNAASYVQQEKEPDSELMPNRSTYNAGATGTRAFYDLLAETGRQVTRWQQPPLGLTKNDQNKPSTFVVIGQTRREFTNDQTMHLLKWVSDGGWLVVIDREPPGDLITTTANWKAGAVSEGEPAIFSVDPSDQTQMTAETKAAKPVQPTVFTKNINAVQSSRFASTVTFERFSDAGTGSERPAPPTATTSPAPFGDGPETDEESGDDQAPPANRGEDRNLQADEQNGEGSGIESAEPPPVIETEEPNETPVQAAPVVHLANNEKNLLVDFSFGSGRIIFLTDPYIVSNGGIGLVDNAQLGINIVAARGGIIAFDEYHQGFGADESRLLSYFAGTPVIAIFLQIFVLIGLILYSQSRRFARPLPAGEPDRLSKLEYVAAMAELQRRTKGFDLALENIYTEFRRRAARMTGVDSRATSRKELARLIAERLNEDEFEIYQLMKKCEDIAHGEPTNKKEVLHLVERLRELEDKLGLKRAGKQIFRK